MVTGGDSSSRGCRFESLHRTLNGHLFTYIVVKIVLIAFNDRNERKKRPEMAHFIKNIICAIICGFTTVGTVF